jgi:hypothetical protein
MYVPYEKKPCSFNWLESKMHLLFFSLSAVMDFLKREKSADEASESKDEHLSFINYPNFLKVLAGRKGDTDSGMSEGETDKMCFFCQYVSTADEK